MKAEKRSKEYIDNYLENSIEFPFSDDYQRKALIKVDLNKVECAFKDGYKQAMKDFITSNENYPLGSNSSDAPWNEEDIEEKELEVTISVTLSKTVTITVDDYKIIDQGVDEDGYSYEEIDYNNCNLKKAVKEQITLPQEKLRDWNVDDYEIIIN